MLLKEYRICMPLSVEEYRIGQLYMIAKHSNEASEKGEGVEIVTNESCFDEVHGQGQFTEKRVHLSSKLPLWMQSMIPRIFYITERAWNYYPYTITEYTCSFIPKFSVHVETRYEDNSGTTHNCLGLNPEELAERELVEIELTDNSKVPPHKYKEAEDPCKFTSSKTGRGPLSAGWKITSHPIMCSYKVVRVKFEVWGLQGRTEAFTHSWVEEVLLMGHRLAFIWMDEWLGMTIEELRAYENSMNADTNRKMCEEAEPVEKAEKEAPETEECIAAS